VATIPVTPAQRVRQQLVGLLDGQEAILVTGRSVGVVQLGQPSVRGLDLLTICAAQDAEGSVGIGGGFPAGRRRAR
jgi:hypothetical protein